ncbi:TRAP transporter small permease [Roseibium sp.]|uniref:TRAP transporter small permease n=1 Tax=Roseibium sp. TaxID=1936156 RepID=UPI003A969B7A
MQVIKKFLDLTELALSVVCVLSFVAMFVLGIATVVFRFIIESSLAFPDELIRYLFIWMISLGSAVALRRNVHAAIGVVVSHLPTVPRRAALVGSSLLGIVFFALILVAGIKLTMRVQSQISPALEISMAWVYGAVPVGMAFLILFSLELVVRQIKAPDAELLADGQ